MTFYEVLEQVVALLQRYKRVSYRALKRQFDLDDEYVEALRHELVFQRVATDEDGQGLVWTGEGPPVSLLAAVTAAPQAAAGAVVVTSAARPAPAPARTEAATLPDGPALPLEPARSAPDAERRQVTVLFCDLVDSTRLSGQLDPEDYRAVVQAYQATAVEAIQPFDGYIAQYLGDGLLVYFGWPQAHEDAARRAVHASLALIDAMASLNARLAPPYGVRVAVRVGLHTGLAVVGAMGSGTRQERLAMGDTPNIAARLQGLAAPNTVALSAATARLVQPAFALEDLGTHRVKGVAEPMPVFRVLGLSAVHGDDEEPTAVGAPFLVGREEEIGLLRRRWAQANAGLGQVVLCGGEAGIGKSALVEVLRADARHEGVPRLAFRCSPYHQHSALFPVSTHLELVGHHYTAAARPEQAIPYWRRAGQQALQRSATPEAVRHLTQGLELLATLPETPARAQQELDLRMALGSALQATKGSAAPEVEQTYARARVLCAQVGETPQLVPALWGLWRFYLNWGASSTARELGEQLLQITQRAAVPTDLLAAHGALGYALYQLGNYGAAQTHGAQGMALIDPPQERAQALRYGVAPGVQCLTTAASTLWCLGSPTQAVQRSQDALALAQALGHSLSLAYAQFFATFLHLRRREAPAVQAQADALLTLATAQGFQSHVGYGTFFRGWALAMQGHHEMGLAQMHQGLAALLAIGQMLVRPLCLVLLAEAMGHAGHVDEGLRLLAEALGAFETSGRGDLLAEAYRLQGELLLQSGGLRSESAGFTPQAALRRPHAAEAEACFQQALAIARRQQAKSWELRAAMSLSRLWPQQGKRTEARELLAPIYGWFTEGFDTADLQEAKALLKELA